MKSTNIKLALVTVLAAGALVACKPEPAAPIAEVPPAAEPAAVEPAPAPVAAPAATDPAAAAPAPAAATEEDEDSPHSGGDKVAPAPSN